MNVDINSFLQQISRLSIGVIGDIMLDRYLFGMVTRISPEAPVPVHAVSRTERRLGGAGNVAANLAQLGARISIYGVVGEDEAGRAIHDALSCFPNIDNGLMTATDRATTSKMRIVGGQQQMLRIDVEENAELLPEIADQLLERLENNLRTGMRGVVISDYNKGVCTEYLCREAISLCHRYHVPIIVDPKGSDWKKYNGADLLTPNLAELSLVSGRTLSNRDEDVLDAGNTILSQYDFDRLAITRSEKGIMLLISGEDVISHPSTAREVFDVSGAGDTVCAVLAAARALNIPDDAALYLANQAAGIVVSKVGTYPITRKDMEKIRPNGEIAATIYTDYSQLAEQICSWQSHGEKVVFTNGCFDLLHRGHVSYLQMAANLGQRLVVAVNSDISVQHLKGKSRPICSAEDRAYLLQALRCVDAVVIFTEDTPKKLLAQLRPDVLVKGGDYRPEEIIGREFVKRVEVLPFLDGYSTTGVIDRIRLSFDKSGENG